MKRPAKWILVTVLTATMMVLGMGYGQAAQQSKNKTSGVTNPMNYKGTVRIASTNVNECMIMAYMAKDLIEAYTGLHATVNTDFTGVAVVNAAMTNNQVDIYPSWVGTSLYGALRYKGPRLTSAEAFKKVKEGFEKTFHETWIKPVGFNDTYIMAVRKATAEKYHLRTDSDLAPYAKGWKLAGDDNFNVLPDAYPGWSKAYGIKFKKVLPMPTGLMYRAIQHKDVNVIAAYSTDARILKLHLVELKDNKGFFPPYNGAYVVRMALLKKYPALRSILEKVSGKLDDTQMLALNYKYDIDGISPKVIAKNFLKEHGYIK